MKDKTFTHFLRAGILLLVLPLLYIILWISISGDDSLTYSEQVMRLMGYFPEFARSPYWLSISFLGMSAISAILSFFAWQKSSRKGVQTTAMIICAIGILLTLLFISIFF